MTWHILNWHWLVNTACSGFIILSIAAVGVHFCRQPVHKLLLIQLTLIGCLLVPWLNQLPGMPQWSIEILDVSQSEMEPTPLFQIDTSKEEPISRSIPGKVAERFPEDQLLVAREGIHEFSGGTSGDLGNQPFATTPPISSPSTEISRAAVHESSNGLSASSISIPGLLVTAYAAAVSAMLLWWLWGTLKLIRLHRSALPASEPLISMFRRISGEQGRRVRLLISDNIEIPLTYGWRRPVILLPKQICETEDASVIQYCLAHEWSHVERKDAAIWYLSVLVHFLFFYQPLLWWLRRQLRLCQDILADARAADESTSAEDYAEFLVGLARRRFFPHSAMALSFIDRRSSLFRRIIMLIQNRDSLERRCRWTWSLGISLVAVLLVGVVSGIRLDAAADFEPQKASDQKQTQVSSKEKKSSNDIKQSKEKKSSNQSSEMKEEIKALTYTGKLTDKTTGQPIEGATVIVRRKLSGGPNHPVRKILQETKHKTNSKGKYTFTISPEQVAERYMYIEVSATHPNYATISRRGSALSMIRKNEKLGERPFFEKIWLTPGETIFGTVLTPEGEPAEGVKILSYSKSNPGDYREYGSFATAFTDEMGQFRVNVVNGGEAVFWILPENYASSTNLVPKQRGDLGTFGLQKGIVLKGTVLNAQGKPVKDVWVEARRQSVRRRSHREELDSTVLNYVSSSIRRSALTNEKGEFAMAPLPPGEYRVTPSERSSDPVREDRTRRPLADVFIVSKVTLKEGEPLEPMEFRAVSHVLIEAQSLDSKGKPQTRGHSIHIFGRINGESFFNQGEPDTNGKISAKVPSYGLENTQVTFLINEHGVLRHRLKKGAPLNNKRRVELGTLNDDMREIEIIRYVAPILLVKAVDKDGNQI